MPCKYKILLDANILVNKEVKIPNILFFNSDARGGDGVITDIKPEVNILLKSHSTKKIKEFVASDKYYINLRVSSDLGYPLFQHTNFKILLETNMLLDRELQNIILRKIDKAWLYA